MRAFSTLHLGHRPSARFMWILALRHSQGRAPPQPAIEPAILPTLFGKGYGLYEIRKGTFLLSFLAHVLASCFSWLPAAIW
jgi:hypothetical protein